MTKGEMRSELVGAGLWDEFVKLREEEKLKGRTPLEAWRVAYERAKRGETALPGIKKKMEIPAPQAVSDDAGVVALETPSGGCVLSPQPTKPRLIGEEVKAAIAEGPGPARVDTGDEILKELKVKREQRKKVSVIESGGNGVELYSKERVLKAFGKKVRPTKKAEDEWVEANIDVAVELEDAPSMGAWSRLMRVRNSPDLMRDFYRGQMAVRAQREESDRFEDDGRENYELIERCEHAIHTSGAEESGGEPEVSAEGD